MATTEIGNGCGLSTEAVLASNHKRRRVFINQYQTQYPLLFATLIVSIAPILILYLLLQRQFIAGLTAGAVRG